MVKRFALCTAALFLAHSLLACVEVVEVSSDDIISALRYSPDRLSVPRPVEGQTWTVTTEYRPESVGSGTSSALAPAGPGQVPSRACIRPGVSASTSWSDFITWEFRVLDADFVPDPGSSFYPFTLGANGQQERATLLEAIVLSEQTRDSAAKLLAPVFRLVLRKSDYRLLGLQVSYRHDGRRQTEFIDLSALGPIALPAVLEQSHIMLDFVIPEFPLDDPGNEEMTVEAIEGGGIEVAFTSVLDGGLVIQRWDAGQPWFTQSRSDDRTSWLGLTR